MNIDEYRKFKAEQETQAKQTQEAPEQTAEVVENKVEETNPTQTETPVVQSTKLSIDGIGEVDINEVKEWKNGYMRNQDYTRKTQEVAAQRKEAEEALKVFQALKANPDALSQITQTPTQSTLDPVSMKLQEVENKLYDYEVEREIDALTRKYPDFDAREVLNIATTRRTNSLEDAYLLHKALNITAQPTNQQQVQQVDVEALREQIRAEMAQELEKERNATQTIISTTDSPTQVSSNEPKLTQQELDFCRRSKTDPIEYAKWRDMKK